MVALTALALLALGMSARMGTDAFVPAFSLGGWVILWLAIAPIATCLVTAITARMTVLKTLAKQY